MQITPSQLLTSRDDFYTKMKSQFLTYCDREGKKPTKRQARKWLNLRNLRGQTTSRD